jgi:hypothetical protein
MSLQLFYLKHLYMFRAFLAHHQEILYCLVSRYGKRKVRYGVRWFGVVGLSMALPECIVTPDVGN